MPPQTTSIPYPPQRRLEKGHDLLKVVEGPRTPCGHVRLSRTDVEWRLRANHDRVHSGWPGSVKLERAIVLGGPRSYRLIRKYFRRVRAVRRERLSATIVISP